MMKHFWHCSLLNHSHPYYLCLYGCAMPCSDCTKESPCCSYVYTKNQHSQLKFQWYILKFSFANFSYISIHAPLWPGFDTWRVHVRWSCHQVGQVSYRWVLQFSSTVTLTSMPTKKWHVVIIWFVITVK